MQANYADHPANLVDGSFRAGRALQGTLQAKQPGRAWAFLREILSETLEADFEAQAERRLLEPKKTLARCITKLPHFGSLAYISFRAVFLELSSCLTHFAQNSAIFLDTAPIVTVHSSQMSRELSESVRDMDAGSSFEAVREAEEASGEAVTDGEHVATRPQQAAGKLPTAAFHRSHSPANVRNSLQA
ncbi:unnamed protein product [Symbiodinium sp. CCMP2456]|nr:unnamed protein product [Symbiodinium sp. CCMP2456]